MAPKLITFDSGCVRKPDGTEAFHLGSSTWEKSLIASGGWSACIDEEFVEGGLKPACQAATCALCAIKKLVCNHSNGAESITLIPVEVTADGCETQNPLGPVTWSFECDPLRACNSGECYDVTHDPAIDGGFPSWWWKRSDGTVVTCYDAKPRR